MAAYPVTTGIPDLANLTGIQYATGRTDYRTYGMRS
jgi:hypothetical protein